MIKNMSIRLKASALVLIPFVGILITIILGLNGMDKMMESEDEMVDKLFIPASKLAKVMQNFQENRVNIRDAIDAESQDRYDVIMKRMNELRADTDKQLELFEKTIASDGLRKMFNELKEKRREYRAMQDHILKLKSEGKKSEAKYYLTTDGDKVTKQEAEMIERIIAKNIALAEEKNNESDAIFEAARAKMLVITIALLAASLAAGFAIVNSISSALMVLKNSMVEFAANKNLHLRVNYDAKDEVGEAAKSFDELLWTLENTIKDAKIISNNNASVSYELSATSALIGKNAEDSVSVVEEARREINDMKSFIAETARLSEKTKVEIKVAGEKLNDAKSEIVSLRREVGKASEAESSLSGKLEQMSKEAGQVKQILLVISEIADQTNLLALNAAIEAARAGDHGKGFAVVADEVRKLAERTQKSLIEINATINTIVLSITDSAEQMSSDAKNIQKLVSVSSSVEVAIMESVEMMGGSMRSVAISSGASTKIAADSEKIVLLIDQINDISSQNARGVEEIAGAAEHLYKLTEDLNAKLNQFKV